MFDTIDLDTDPTIALGDAVATLATEDADDWPGSAPSERLVGLVEVRERLDAAITRLTGRWDRTEAWRTDGAPSGTSWPAHRTALPRHKARKLIGTARLVTDHPVVDQASVAGDVGTEHLEVVTNVAGEHRQDLVADSIGCAGQRRSRSFGRRLPHGDPPVGGRWPTTRSPTRNSPNSMNDAACTRRRRWTAPCSSTDAWIPMPGRR